MSDICYAIAEYWGTDDGFKKDSLNQIKRTIKTNMFMTTWRLSQSGCLSMCMHVRQPLAQYLTVMLVLVLPIWYAYFSSISILIELFWLFIYLTYLSILFNWIQGAEFKCDRGICTALTKWECKRFIWYVLVLIRKPSIMSNYCKPG